MGHLNNKFFRKHIKRNITGIKPFPQQFIQDFFTAFTCNIFTNGVFVTAFRYYLTKEAFAVLVEEDPLYQEVPNAKQAEYIRRLVKGVDEHAAELDGYIEKYAKGWKFSRIPLVASAIMRVAMYEILYMPDVPNGAAINEAVEIAKKYETPETVKFINGILGSFVRQEVSE